MCKVQVETNMLSGNKNQRLKIYMVEHMKNHILSLSGWKFYYK